MFWDCCSLDSVNKQLSAITVHITLDLIRLLSVLHTLFLLTTIVHNKPVLTSIQQFLLSLPILGGVLVSVLESVILQFK